MDEPIPDLPERPLLPSPDEYDLLEDIYTVGKQKTERWRSYIDCLDWDPRQFHDTLLRSRAYHARTVWEAAQVLAIANSDWLSKSTYEGIFNVAHLELRCVEFELVSYQLTCRMLGIRGSVNQLESCCFVLMVACRFFVERVMRCDKASKKMLSLLQRLKPGYNDAPSLLAKNIDKLVFTLQALLKERSKFPTNFLQSPIVGPLTLKLRNAIISLDNVLVVC